MIPGTKTNLMFSKWIFVWNERRSCAKTSLPVKILQNHLNVEDFRRKILNYFNDIFLKMIFWTKIGHERFAMPVIEEKVRLIHCNRQARSAPWMFSNLWDQSEITIGCYYIYEVQTLEKINTGFHWAWYDWSPQQYLKR